MKNNFVAKHMGKFNRHSIHVDKKYKDSLKLRCEDKEDIDSTNLTSYNKLLKPVSEEPDYPLDS